MTIVGIDISVFSVVSRKRGEKSSYQCKSRWFEIRISPKILLWQSCDYHDFFNMIDQLLLGLSVKDLVVGVST